MRRMIDMLEMRSQANMRAKRRVTNIIISTTIKLTGMMEIRRSMIEKIRSTMIMVLKSPIRLRRTVVTDLDPGIEDGDREHSTVLSFLSCVAVEGNCSIIHILDTCK